MGRRSDSGRPARSCGAGRGLHWCPPGTRRYWPRRSAAGSGRTTSAADAPLPPGPGAAHPAAPPPAVPADATHLAQVWDVAGGKELFRARVSGTGGPAVAAAFSPDGARVAVAAGDGPVDVWDVKAGRRL